MQEVTEETHPEDPILLRTEESDLSCLRHLLPADAQTHHRQFTSGPLHLLLLLQSSPRYLKDLPLHFALASAQMSHFILEAFHEVRTPHYTHPSCSILLFSIAIILF